MLYREYMTDCVIMVPTAGPDREGGQNITWAPSMTGEKLNTFSAAIIEDSNAEQLVAMQRGWNGSFSVYTDRATMLKHFDVVKRISDGQMFRIRADAIKKTPPSAGLDLRVVNAEMMKL